MRKLNLILIIIFLVVTFSIKESYGIPAFARKYKTSCATCHYAFPMLNAFGKAFYNNGFRWPGGDSNYVKEDPVDLGANGNKRAFPDAIWPADIPGTAPFSVYVTGQISYQAMNDVKWDFATPNYLNVLYGGTIGDNFSVFGETEFNNSGNSWTGDFTGFIQWDQSPGLHIKAGEVRADPTKRDVKLSTNDYNIEDFQSRNGWSYSNTQFGLELWGALNGPENRGGLTYRFGVVNGQGITAIKPQKDFCGMVTYKIGGLSEIGITKGVKTTSMHPYEDNSLTLGTYFYKGTEISLGSTTGPDENLSVLGGEAELWYGRFIFDASAMFMNSQMPDSIGASTTNTRNSLLYYIQGNAVVYPWLIGLVRFESTDADKNDKTLKPVTSIIPGITILARANVKLNLELQKFLDDLDKKNTRFSLRVSYGI